MEKSEIGQRIVAILGLECSPLAVKFLKPGDSAPPGYDDSQKLRYCQSLMMAKRGRKVLLSGENITCPAAAAGFGFKPLPEKLARGEMMHVMGSFATPAAAATTMELMPRLKQGECSGVLVTSLEQAEFEPNVVVLEGEPEKLTWAAQADTFDEGGRHSFETGVLQATCIDVTLVPYVKGKLNANLGCYGCRDGTDIPCTETVLGLPGSHLERIAGALEKLAEKAIPRSRAKGAYLSLAARDEQNSCGD